MCDLKDFSYELNKPITALVLNVTTASNIWADYYTGPNGLTMTIVFLVIIGLWAGSFILNWILKRKYAVRAYENLEDPLA